MSLPVRRRNRWTRCATLTNHSTGKMGYAVARACMLRGADVTLLASTGCTLPPVPFVNIVPFTTAADLFGAVKGQRYGR